MKLSQKLQLIQSKLKVGKGHRNQFGNYNYRNLADIFEGLKPLLEKTKCYVTVSDDIETVNGFNYIRATATFSDGDEKITTEGWAREAVQKKGMDDSQITGATSSYARKYALNGLFAIDDTEDADSMDNREHKTVVPTSSAPDIEILDQSSDTWDEDARSSGIPFGKHKGTPWKDVPEGYINWVINSSDNANYRRMANAELVARIEGASSEKPVEKGWAVEEDVPAAQASTENMFEEDETSKQDNHLSNIKDEGGKDDIPW